MHGVHGVCGGGGHEWRRDAERGGLADVGDVVDVLGVDEQPVGLLQRVAQLALEPVPRLKTTKTSYNPQIRRPYQGCQMTHLQVLGVRGEHRVEALDHPVDPVGRRRQWLRDSQRRRGRQRHHRSQRRVGEAGRGGCALGQGAAALLGTVVPAKRNKCVNTDCLSSAARLATSPHRTNSDLV